ncbi:MAG: ABC transporter permease [Pseudoxanthomonas sp.]
MLAYYLDLALRSLRRNKVLSALMVLAIGLGIGTTMTTFTVFHILSGDPLPDRSGRLFYVQLEPRPLHHVDAADKDPAPQMTRRDAETLLAQARGDRQAMMSAGVVAIEPDAAALAPFTEEARYTSTDFFPMFGVPLARGAAWSRQDDADRARVAVIGRELAAKLFGDADPVGRSVPFNGTSFRIVGVLGDWDPNPRFYDLTTQRYGDAEQVLVPFSTARGLHWGIQGTTECWGDDAGGDSDGSYALDAHCAWIQYWVELDSPARAADYRRYLEAYSDQQRAAGRFELPNNVRLSDVMTWLDFNHVVPGDVRLQLWLALGFLLVCLLNTVGLLLAKFLRRGGEIGVRRALGASRRDVFAQFLVEAGVVGLAGGVLGLALAWIGLWLVRQQPADYAALARMDAPMLGLTFVLALLASLLAGLLPAWRAMQIAPAVQLKTQ